MAYTYPTTGAGVKAYIVDTGIDINHSDFGGRASNGYDAIDQDNVAQDCNGHGTHVAGTVGGTKYGVAKAVNLVAVRVLDCDGSGTTEQVLAGIDWVTANAQKPAVVNMSLGGPEDPDYPALSNAVSNSIATGLTYAVAAGNDADDACYYTPARVSAAITPSEPPTGSTVGPRPNTSIRTTARASTSSLRAWTSSRRQAGPPTGRWPSAGPRWRRRTWPEPLRCCFSRTRRGPRRRCATRS